MNDITETETQDMMRKPRFPSNTRAVAIRSFGRKPIKPAFIVVMISLYCSVVKAIVFLFIVPSRGVKFVFVRGISSDI